MPTEAVPTDVPPTETAVIEPTVAPTDEPTLAPTSAESPTLEPTASSTDTATVEPTASATDEPTATETASPSPTPGFPIQDRTISEDEVPDQVFSTGAFRYTVEYAERAAEIPNLELPAVDAGEWVVIVLNAQNWSDEPATLNMADFQLLVSGDFGYQFVGMDASSPDISRFLGFDPVLEIAELRSIQTGEGLRLALVYLVPPTTTGIELIDDTSGLNIAPSLAIGGDVTALGSAPERPDLIEAVVTEVIDGRTIVVEADGFPATIQYLGIVVPTGDECFAFDSTQTNSNIVLGQTVYLERRVPEPRDGRGRRPGSRCLDRQQAGWSRSGRSVDGVGRRGCPITKWRGRALRGLDSGRRRCCGSERTGILGDLRSRAGRTGNSPVANQPGPAAVRSVPDV